jgi:hypothetical protein
MDIDYISSTSWLNHLVFSSDIYSGIEFYISDIQSS